MGEPQRDTGYTKFQEETSVKDSSLFWSVSRIPFDRSVPESGDFHV